MPDTPSNPHIARYLQQISVVLGITAGVIGIVAWIGALVDRSVLASIFPGWPTMKPLTASCFIIGALTIYGFRRSSSKKWHPGVFTGGVLLLAIALFSTFDFFLNWAEHVDPEHSFLLTLTRPMAPASSTIVFVFGAAFLALGTGSNRLTQYIALINLIFGVIGVIGLVFGLEVFSRSMVLSTMSLNTSLATVCLAAAILFVRPEQGLMKIVTEDIAGAVLRRTLPFIVGVPILFGWLRIKAEQRGLIDPTVAVTLVVVGTILVFTLIVAHLARHLQRAELARQRAEAIVRARDEQLRKEHAELEQTVAHRTEQLRATIQSLETFVYTIAHDLRAPLRAMHGFTIALKEEYSDQLDATGKEYCQRIAGASQRMDQLLTDLLEFGQLSQVTVSHKLVDLNREVDTVLIELQESIDSRQAVVEIVKPLPTVCAEPKILDQVLINLVSNALKFIPPHVTPRIRIHAETRADEVRVWVEDNGIGIAPEHHNRIFEVFQRLHGTDEYPGTGIGLAIVQKGIEQMGGRVGVQSEAGKGSRFWFDLPGQSKCMA